MPLFRSAFTRIAAVALLALGSGPAIGHLLNMSRVQIDFQPPTTADSSSPGRITAVLQLDLTRALGGANAFHQASLATEPLSLPALAELSRRVGNALQLRIDGQSVVWQPAALAFSSQSLEDYQSNIVWPRATLRLEGIPAPDLETPAATDRQVGTSAAFELRLAPTFPFEEPIAMTLHARPDGAGKPVTMTRWLVVNQRFPTPRPKLLAALKLDGAATMNQSARAEAAEAPEQRVLSTFLWLGLTHVLPGGWDHLAFVFGLLLLASSLRSTFVLLSVYTIGHTLSYLALALRWVPTPGAWAESLILFSLFWVGASLWWHRDQRDERQRFAAAVGVFGFGLVHGLGFASSLATLPTDPGALFSSVIGFNLGIEVAQLSVALIAGLLLALPTQGVPAKQRYRRHFSAALMALPVLVFLMR